MNLTNEFIKVLKLGHTDKGHFAEQLGMAWLMKNGYWVFKNLAPQGPIDCVAVHKSTNDVVLVDIKTVSYHGNGYVRARNISNLQIQLQVKILYVDVETFTCRWRGNHDDIKDRHNANGQFVKKKFT